MAHKALTRRLLACAIASGASVFSVTVGSAAIKSKDNNNIEKKLIHLVLASCICMVRGVIGTHVASAVPNEQLLERTESISFGQRGELELERDRERNRPR